MAKTKRRRPMAEINVVPYIDVMLVLLVIFMVAAPLMTQGIKVNLPEAGSGSIDVDEDMIIVTIDSQRQYFINVGEADEPVALEMIAEKAKKIISANPKIKVLVEGDESLNYGVVINVMNILQTAGADSVALITEPPST